jgi:hypothetical protein
MCNQYIVKTLVKTLPPYDGSKYEPLPEVDINPPDEEGDDFEI